MWSNDRMIFKPWEWTTIDGVLHGVRILGVLQRIALAYLFSSLIIYFFKTKAAFVFSAFILLMYWFLCFAFGDKTDPYSLSGYFGTHIDKSILGEAHMYHGEGVAFDPEGIASTLTSIVQVIFGYIVGEYIQQKGRTYEMLSNLFIAGTILVFSGFIWDMVFPINKKIWTSSYTIYTSGLATITIATMIFLIEYRNVRGWLTKFFDVFGKNALFVFALSSFLPRTLALIRIPDHLNDKGKMVYINPWNWLYQKVLIHVPGDPRIGSLLYAVCVITFMWAICYWMDRKRIYVKV